jgi:hypothetical protein
MALSFFTPRVMAGRVKSGDDRGKKKEKKPKLRPECNGFPTTH